MVLLSGNGYAMKVGFPVNPLCQAALELFEENFRGVCEEFPYWSEAGKSVAPTRSRLKRERTLLSAALDSEQHSALHDEMSGLECEK